MDAFILVFTLAILLAIGVPVAYAVGLSAIAGAFWIDLPLEAVMIQITSGVNNFPYWLFPSLFWRVPLWRRAVLHDAGQLCLYLRGLYPRWPVIGEYCRLNIFWCYFRLFGGRYRLYRLSDDP